MVDDAFLHVRFQIKPPVQRVIEIFDLFYGRQTTARSLQIVH